MDFTNNQTLNNSTSFQPKRVGPFTNPKAIIAILIFLVTIIPLLVYFGVKSQQSIQSKAENDPDCTSNAGYNCTNQGTSWCQGNNRCICGNDAFTHKIGNPWCDADGKYYECKNSSKTKIANSCPGAPTPTPDGGSFTQRSKEKVCTDNQGTPDDIPNCAADPKCKDNGGICCNKSDGQYCCYGDSATRQDGACYKGTNSGVSCSGNTITNNTNQPVTIKHFIGNSNDRCPISTPGGEDTILAPGAPPISAGNCEQIEAVGYCGVCNDSSCGGGENPTPTPTTPTLPSPTPTTSPGQCKNIGIYDTTWKAITDLTTLKAGQIVRITTVGTDGGNYDLARFRVNNGVWLPSASGTAQVSPNNEYYYEYTIPTGVTSFTVEAMVHETTQGWK